MKKDIAKLWVKTLRSGEYKQGQSALNKNGKFCCLGVLCEIAIKEGILLKKEDINGQGYFAYNELYIFPPDSIISWAGLKNRMGQFRLGSESLAELNDNGKSFKEIADIIETNVEKL